MLSSCIAGAGGATNCGLGDKYVSLLAGVREVTYISIVDANSKVEEDVIANN